MTSVARFAAAQVPPAPLEMAAPTAVLSATAIDAATLAGQAFELAAARRAARVGVERFVRVTFDGHALQPTRLGRALATAEPLSLPGLLGSLA